MIGRDCFAAHAITCFAGASLKALRQYTNFFYNVIYKEAAGLVTLLRKERGRG